MLDTNNMADCSIPYKWLLEYQDHFTKYLILRPLKHKSTVEVADLFEEISVTSVLLTSSSQTIEANPATAIYSPN